MQLLEEKIRMKKTERSGANATTKCRANKSFINVKMFEPVIKKFTLSSESDSLLLDYVEFLKASSKKNFSADAVMEALIEKLNEDKIFKVWLVSKKNEQKNLKHKDVIIQND